jgi:soluble lytic murein transglycosylase-like protein
LSVSSFMGWVTIVVTVAAAWVPVQASDDQLMYFVQEDGNVVFTNAPSRHEARPVPGLEVWDALGISGTDLPATVYDPFIDRVAREHGLSPELIKAVALVESGFNTHAVSPKGAQGLMQLMPATARQYGVKDAFDPLQNLRAGTIHLRKLLDEFDGDLTLTLAAYNAGSGAVRRHGGVPAYRETQEYVRKVQSNLSQGRRRAISIPPQETSARIVQNSDGTIRLVN